METFINTPFHIIYVPYKNKEDEKRHRQEYYQKHKDEIIKRSVEWRKQNRDRRNIWKKDYYQKNKEKHYEGIKKSRQKYIESARERVRKYRAKMKAEAGTLVGKKCLLCGGNKRLIFHEINYKPHKMAASTIFLVKKNPENFTRLCQGCHTMVHVLHNSFNIQLDELQNWLQNNHLIHEKS